MKQKAEATLEYERDRLFQKVEAASLKHKIKEDFYQYWLHNEKQDQQSDCTPDFPRVRVRVITIHPFTIEIHNKTEAIVIRH